MDLEKLNALIDLAEARGLLELEVREADQSVRIVRGTAAPVAAATAPAVQEPPPSPAAAAIINAGFINAAMAGTFYRAPAPEAEPFVAVGATVTAGQTLALIESMKMMNPVTADRSGVIEAVLVDNATPVATGQPLFRIA